ncbi:hypothetical protein FHR25_005218 [Yokenella regensburgei]|nr:hypothetical protein FHR25_005218 [Yokenella regensburgei]
MFRFVLLWFPFVVRMRFALMADYLDIFRKVDAVISLRNQNVINLLSEIVLQFQIKRLE